MQERESGTETISGSDLAERIKSIGGENGELIFISFCRVFLLGKRSSVDTPKEEIIKTLPELSKLTFNKDVYTIPTRTFEQYELSGPNNSLELILATSAEFIFADLLLTGKSTVNNADTWKLNTNYSFVNGEPVFTGGINSYISDGKENTTQIWMKGRFNGATGEFDPIIIFSVRPQEGLGVSRSICLPFISPSQAKDALAIKSSE